MCQTSLHQHHGPSCVRFPQQQDWMWRTVELKWKGQAGSAQLVIDRQVEGPISLVRATTSALLLICSWDGQFGVPVLRKGLRPVIAMGEMELIPDVSPCQPRPCPTAAEQGEQARPVKYSQIQLRAQVTRQVYGDEAGPRSSQEHKSVNWD